MPLVISKLVMAQMPEGEPFCVVDAGAQAGVETRKWLFWGNRLRLDGFEPDAAECEKLNEESRRAGVASFYHPVCLGEREGTNTLYVTRRPDSSSLYRPARERLMRYKHSLDGRSAYCLNDSLTVDKIVESTTTTLDKWAETNKTACIDFIKLDVQGAELDILRGGANSLQQVLGIEAEVEFVPMYEGQPLFADVDGFVRGQGFMFFNLLFTHAGHFAGRMASQVIASYQKNPILMQQIAGQLLSADAFYLIDPLDPSWPAGRKLSLGKYLKLMVIAEAYVQIEFAFELLAALRDGQAPLSEAVDGAGFGGMVDLATQQYLSGGK